MVDIVELQKSEFWRKKIPRAVEGLDVNNSDSITQSDFFFIVYYYKKYSETTTINYATVVLNDFTKSNSE